MDLYVYDSGDGPIRHVSVKLERRFYLLVHVNNNKDIVNAAVSFVRSNTRRGQELRVFLRTRRSLGAADTLLRRLEVHERKCRVMECGNVLLQDVLRLSKSPTSHWSTGLTRHSIQDGITLVKGATSGIKKAQTVCIVTNTREYMHRLCYALDITSSPLRDVIVVCPSKGAKPTMCELIKAATSDVFAHMTITICDASHDAYYTENDHHASKIERVASNMGIKVTRYPDWFDTMLMHGGVGRHLVDMVGCVRSRRGWLHMDVRPDMITLALLSVRKLLFLEFHVKN